MLSFEKLRQVYKDKIRAVRLAAAAEAEVDAVLDTALRQQGQQDDALFDAPPAPTPTPTPSLSPPSSPYSPLPAAPPGVKTLASFVDVEKLAAHSDPKEIELIWRAVCGAPRRELRADGGRGPPVPHVCPAAAPR